METSLPFWYYALSMGAYIGVLLLIVEIMRKNIRFALVFWLLSLLTFPLWGENVEGWFRWAKTLSVLVPTAVFVGFGRYAEFKKSGNWLKIFRGDWILWFLYGVLFLNIAEATIKDFATGNYFNAICGVILCITQPLVKYRGIKKKFWSIGVGKEGDLVVFTNVAWNFLYTTWNLAFVYGEAGSFFASSCCILLAAELYPILKRRPELYVIARVYTLATHILIRACGDIFTPVMNSATWYNPVVLNYWGFINLCLHVPYLFIYFRNIHKLRVAEATA